MKEIYRVNYANEKHHREQLREQIDPRVIQQIEVDHNPSQNYKNAFKAVYFDELERTMKFQEDKKNRENHVQEATQWKGDASLYRNTSVPSLHSTIPFQNMSPNIQETAGLRTQGKSIFVDYDEERKKKFEHLIEKRYDGGQSFFRSQDQYQKRRQEENQVMKNVLLQQLQLKENQKMQEYEAHSIEAETVKENRRRQLAYEQSQAERQRAYHLQLGQQVKQQAEHQRIKRHKKSYFEINCKSRHNPITNPIEYHIDNPYILQRYTNKVHETSQDCTNNESFTQYKGQRM